MEKAQIPAATINSAESSSQTQEVKNFNTEAKAKEEKEEDASYLVSPNKLAPQLSADPTCVGYRDSRNNKIYINSVTQTVTPLEIKATNNKNLKCHRDVQTKTWQTKSVQSTRDAGTQMNRQDLAVNEHENRVIIANEYCPADVYQERILKHVINIQCFFRMILAMKKASRRHELHKAKIDMMEGKQKRKEELLQYTRKREIERRVHPKTPQDFALLYSGLEKWRQMESSKIKSSGLNSDEKSVQYKKLLMQEATMIQQLCTLKVQASDEAHRRNTLNWINKMASPKQWPTPSGRVVEVETPSTQRANELRRIYLELLRQDTAAEQRLATLLTVKNIVRQFDCDLCSEIVSLVNREGDLISRERDGFFLEGLRKRINTLFLEFIANPQFNPEAENTSRNNALSPQAKAKKLYKCRSCLRHLPNTSFPLTSLSKDVVLCSGCQKQKQEACQRNCDDQYVRMLGLIRMNEAAYTEPGIVARFMTVRDVREFVEVLWGAHSAVSGACRDVSRLVIVRWDGGVELSPWNAVLLTMDEARIHTSGRHYTQLYSEEFCSGVQTKLELARKKYSRLYEFLLRLRSDTVLLDKVRSSACSHREIVDQVKAIARRDDAQP